ncbi:predicted protein [Chaetoceros tenuissimus]|uniref:AP2/ERF domain-containing protein n=1 Tax=Chaetoceros tenuissimus TaxID=426638 RepID=A0AAD3CPH9_9STRA|nr:predicted protein [Chaetoceros tenuissimus]
MSSHNKLKPSRKRSRTNITAPLSDNGISNLNEAVERDEAKLAHGDIIKDVKMKNAIDEKDENYSDGTIPDSSSSSTKRKRKGKQSTTKTKKPTTKTKKPTTSTKKKQNNEASEKRRQRKAATKEANKARREELEKDKDYLDAHDELQRLKLLFDLKELDPERGQKCIWKEFRKMSGLKESFAEFDKDYGEESLYHEDLSIMENLVHSFVKAVDFKEALIIIFLHFPTLNIVKTSLEKSGKSDKCFQSATINLILKTLMLILKANHLIDEDFDLAQFNMLLFDINPVKADAQAFKGVNATKNYENIPEECRPASLKTDEDYAKFRHDTDKLLRKIFEVLIEKAQNKVFIVEHGAWTKDFAKDLADATKVIVESCCHPHKLLSLFATEDDIRQIFRTYIALFRLADKKEYDSIWPTEDELNLATRFWAAGAILPQCMDKDSPEFEQWKDTLPQCMKDSEQFFKWLETAPQDVPKNSPEYIKWIMEHPLKDSEKFCEWYLKLIMSLPQCSPKYSKKFQDWIDSHPSSMPKDSPKFLKWYKNRFGREYTDSQFFALRAKLDDHKQELQEQQGQSPKESSNAVSAPNTQAMRPIPGYQYYQNPPVAGFSHCPPPSYPKYSGSSQFHPQYSGLPHYPPQFDPQYSGFHHHSQAFHQMPYHPMQSVPLPAQQLTSQQRLPISTEGQTDEEINQYDKPLDTSLYTHRNLSDEYDAEGRVHNFIDPQDKKFNGVSFRKPSKKYVAQIFVYEKKFILGEFALESDAAKAFDDYAIMLNRKRSEENRRKRYKVNFRNEHEYLSARNKEIEQNRKKKEVMLE